MAKLTTGEKVHAIFMLCVAAGIAFSVVFAVVSLMSTESVVVCIFRRIRTVNPDLSGHGTGNIRTVIRRHPDTCRAI